jgi:WD40 repeat protein
MNSSDDAVAILAIRLKWGRTTFANKNQLITIRRNGNRKEEKNNENGNNNANHHQGSQIIATLKQDVEELTSVPCQRQKLICKALWKGVLKDTREAEAELKSNIQKCHQQNNQNNDNDNDNALVVVSVTLIGSAETLQEKPQEQRTKFIEDMSEAELKDLEQKELIDRFKHSNMHNISTSLPVGDIIAIQCEPGQAARLVAQQEQKTKQFHSGGANATGRQAMYQEHRLIKGLSQYHIQEKLRERQRATQPTKLIGDVVMTMGRELGRGYVNSLAVLNNGTLVSALDDGHVQLWNRGHLIKDVVHGTGGGVEHVMSIPTSNGNGNTKSLFVTGGIGMLKVWNDQAKCFITMRTPQGTSPASITTGSLFNNDSDCKQRFIACCVKVTRQENPNQFHLIPQDAEGRRRRAQAQALEIQTRQHLQNVSTSVRYWIFNESDEIVSRRDSLNLSQGSIHPTYDFNNHENFVPAAIIQVATTRDYLICADEFGGLSPQKFAIASSINTTPPPTRQSSSQFNNNDDASNHFTPSTFIQLFVDELSTSTSTNESLFCCTISCMEPIKDNLLAVATDFSQTMTSSNETQGRFSSSSSSSSSSSLAGSSVVHLKLPHPRAVSIIDLDNKIVQIVLNAHKDSVRSICLTPSGDILTAGGKFDATVKVWDCITWTTAMKSHVNNSDIYLEQQVVVKDVNPENAPVLTDAETLKEPGYVFDLKILPSELDTALYVVACARYNVIKIVV